MKALLVVLAVLAAPVSAQGIRPFAPPAKYAAWWDDVVRDCACTPAVDYAAVEWYASSAMSPQAFACGSRQCAGAWVDRDGIKAIVLAPYWRDDPMVVKHEMLHAILGGDAGHTAAVWLKYERCLGEAKIAC